jgi:uncharacterized protein (TIGR01244 family)
MRRLHAAILLLAACSTPEEADAPFTGQPLADGNVAGIAGLVEVGPRVLLAGQPTPEGLQNAKHAGVTLVINMRPESELAFNERQMVESLGMEYVNIPVTLQTLDDASVEAFLGQMAELRLRPGSAERVLVHCSSGNRVAALWAMYEIAEGGLPPEEAVARARRAGLKSAELVQFIGDWSRRREAP